LLELGALLVHGNRVFGGLIRLVLFVFRVVPVVFPIDEFFEGAALFAFGLDLLVAVSSELIDLT